MLINTQQLRLLLYLSYPPTPQISDIIFIRSKSQAMALACKTWLLDRILESPFGRGAQVVAIRTAKSCQNSVHPVVTYYWSDMFNDRCSFERIAGLCPDSELPFKTTASRLHLVRSGHAFQKFSSRHQSSICVCRNKPIHRTHRTHGSVIGRCSAAHIPVITNA